MRHIEEFAGVYWPAGQEQPDIRPAFNPKYKRLYRARDDASYEWAAEYEGMSDYFHLYRPGGFYSDGQSAPQIAWSLGFTPDGLCRMPADVHDALYRSRGGILCPIPDGINKGMEIIIRSSLHGRVTLGRKACDQLYLYSYLSVGKCKRENRKARLGYLALRIGGKRHFGKEMPGKR